MSGTLVLEDVQARVWEDFQRGARAEAPAPLLDCWSRARGLGAPSQGARVDEALLRGEALRMHVEQLDLVRALGDSVLERAAARVSARDYLLLVADAEGVVVETSGGGAFADTARSLRLIQGACWSEAARGTNAIGTAASLNQATVVRGHAHFGRSYHGLVCYAAPIRGFDGTPLAVLDATSVATADAPEVGEVVRLAAHALEELLRMHAFASAGASVTRVLGRALDRMREPVLLVEAPGRVARANGSARAELGAALVGSDPRQLFGMSWAELAREALAPESGGRPCRVGDWGRPWRMRAEPITGAGGAVLAVLVHLEPVATPASPRPSPSAPPSAQTPQLFAEDAATLRAVDWARRLAASDVPVMLLAETGAGKELVASMIHEHSPRAGCAFVALNCGAIAPSLLESELFGYAAGAFTGADRGGRAGLLHAASGGTLFLDEVAEMSPAMQASLLRVLEAGIYRRVGDTRTSSADVRVVCATCRDLPTLVASGAFRQDLYFRLKGASVRIPPLRERSDVAALARHLLQAMTGPEPSLSPAAEQELSRRAWPGNVRELKSVLEVAVIAAGGAPWIEPEHLGSDDPAPSAPVSLADSEAGAVQRALAACEGNVSTAARRLGVARSTLYRMMRRHGLA